MARAREHSKGQNKGRFGIGPTPADWSLIDGSLLLQAVQVHAGRGGALRLGYTRDGTSYAIGIYDGDDYETVYTADNKALEELLETLGNQTLYQKAKAQAQD